MKHIYDSLLEKVSGNRALVRGTLIQLKLNPTYQPTKNLVTCRSKFRLENNSKRIDSEETNTNFSQTPVLFFSFSQNDARLILYMFVVNSSVNFGCLKVLLKQPQKPITIFLVVDSKKKTVLGNKFKSIYSFISYKIQKLIFNQFGVNSNICGFFSSTQFLFSLLRWNAKLRLFSKHFR